MLKKIAISMLATACCLAAGTAAAAKPSPANECVLQKQKIAVEYMSCLFKLDFTSSKSGTGVGSNKPCDTKFDDKWAKIESATAADGVTPACPTDVDTGLAQDPAQVKQSLRDSYDAYWNYFLGMDPLPQPYAPPATP